MTTEIPLSAFTAVGANDDMPWVYEESIGDPIEYRDQGKGAVRWSIGQQVRVMYPIKCTRCWNAARGDAPPEEFIGLVSVLQRRADAGRGPTEWVTYCVDHFDRRAQQGKV